MDSLVITPEDAERQVAKSIPAEVFAAFNELIVANLRDGTAVVKQCDVVNEIRARLDPISREHLLMRWLDVEPIYRAAGWEVEYDKPGYNESYEPVFTFKKK